MINEQHLPIWKRATIAVQLLTFPVWYLPFCLLSGIAATWADIPYMFARGWQLISARRQSQQESSSGR